MIIIWEYKGTDPGVCQRSEASLDLIEKKPVLAYGLAPRMADDLRSNLLSIVSNLGVNIRAYRIKGSVHISWGMNIDRDSIKYLFNVADRAYHYAGIRVPISQIFVSSDSHEGQVM